jgi:hypothetical protein
MKVSNVQKQFIILILLFAAALYFWNSIIVYPIKLFVVLLHEMSHGIAAIVLGGSIKAIEISSRVGGYCSYTIPQNLLKEIIIASAGYLGSIIWGGVIFLSASKVQKDRYISLIIGIVMLFLSFFVIQSGEIFGIIYCFLTAFLLILSFKYIKDWLHDYMLKFIGLTSCLYVIVDIKTDLIGQSGIGSDADQIAQLTGIPSSVTGIAWALIACIILYYFIKKFFDIADKPAANDNTLNIPKYNKKAL